MSEGRERENGERREGKGEGKGESENGIKSQSCGKCTARHTLTALYMCIASSPCYSQHFVTQEELGVSCELADV